MSRVNKKAFGEYIRNKRIELGLTQEELAQKLNVSNMTISKWENGKRYPDFEMVDDIASVFNVSVEEIFEHSRTETENGFHMNIGLIVLAIMVGIIGTTGVLKTVKNKESDEFVLSYETYYKDGHLYEYYPCVRVISEDRIEVASSMISSTIWGKGYTYEREGNILHLVKDESNPGYLENYCEVADEIDVEIIDDDKFIFEGNVYMPVKDSENEEKEETEYIISNGTYIRDEDEMKGYIEIEYDSVMIGFSLWASAAEFYTCERDGNTLYLKYENKDNSDKEIKIIDDNTLSYEGKKYKLDAFWNDGMVVQTEKGILIYLQGIGLAEIINLTELDSYNYIQSMKTGDKVKVYCDSDCIVTASDPCSLGVKDILPEDEDNVRLTDEEGNQIKDEDLINKLCGEYSNYGIIAE